MKKINSKGFTLVEVMVVVAIIGLLVAVTLPSISHFRRKASVGSLVKELGGMTQKLQTYYQTESGLNTLTLDANGTITDINGLWVGNLPPHPEVSWAITQSTQNQLDISWTFNTVCPSCDGIYCIVCEDDVGCSVSIQVEDQAFALNRNPNNIPCVI